MVHATCGVSLWHWWTRRYMLRVVFLSDTDELDGTCYVSCFKYNLLLRAIKVTRKHRQSYWHADPRQQRPRGSTAQGYGMLAIVTSNGDSFCNRVTLTFDISWSMHAERLLWSIRVPRSVSIAQTVFLLEAEKQTDATEWPTYAGGINVLSWIDRDNHIVHGWSVFNNTRLMAGSLRASFPPQISLPLILIY